MSDQWFIARGKQKAGPFTFVELIELARTGGLLSTEMILQGGTVKWQSASQIEGLFWRTDHRSGSLPLPLPLETTESLLEQSVAPHPETPLPVPDLDFQIQPEPPHLLTMPAEEKEQPLPEATTDTTLSSPLPIKDVPPPPATLPPRATKRRMSLARWSAAAFVLSATLGLLGDFLQPVLAFNLIVFALASGLAITSLVLWVKQVGGLGSSFSLAFFILACVALGFGLWWGTAFFNGGQDKGLLAAHSRFIARLQSAVVRPAHGGDELEGVWVIGPDESPEAELDIHEGRLTWRVGSRTRIEAEYGITKGGVVYAIITRVESDVKALEMYETFSFWFRTEDGTLTVRELKGSGLDELKKAAQGRYKKRR